MKVSVPVATAGTVRPGASARSVIEPLAAAAVEVITVGSFVPISVTGTICVAGPL